MTAPTVTDQVVRALAERARRGNTAAFGELYRLHHPVVVRLLQRRVGDRHVAEDLASEAFIRAWRRMPAFEWSGSGFVGWVSTIAGNVAIDHMKAAHQQRSHPDPMDGSVSLWQHADQDRWVHPGMVAEVNEIALVLAGALAGLTVDQRRCLFLRFLRGLSVEETADQLCLSDGAVKALTGRAIASMRRHPGVVALCDSVMRPLEPVGEAS